MCRSRVKLSYRKTIRRRYRRQPKTNQYATRHDMVIDKIWINLVLMRHLSEEHEN